MPAAVPAAVQFPIAAFTRWDKKGLAEHRLLAVVIPNWANLARRTLAQRHTQHHKGTALLDLLVLRQCLVNAL